MVENCFEGSKQFIKAPNVIDCSFNSGINFTSNFHPLYLSKRFLLQLLKLMYWSKKRPPKMETFFHLGFSIIYLSE